MYLCTTEAKTEEETGGSKGGIRLGRLRKTGNDKKSSSSAATGGNDMPQLGESDMERLRTSIQTLVQHTGPLGGCLDYLQVSVVLSLGLG